MKKIGLLALVVALSVALFALWRVTREKQRPADAPETAAAPALPADAARAELSQAELDRSGAESSGAPRENLPESHAQGGKLESWDLERSIWVQGSVRAPLNCTDDGPVEVFATSAPADAGSLAAWLAFEKPHPALLSRRPVAADGNFRVPFPPDARQGHVSLRGRYQFTAESVEIDLGAVPQSVELEPKCGAWITGTVRLPPGTSVALADLADLEVEVRSSVGELQGNVGDFDGFRRIARMAPAAPGTFEVRAVPAGAGCSISIEPKLLAVKVEKVERLEPGRENPVQIDLLRGGTVSGVVRDPDGKPLAGAEVEAALPGRFFGFDNRTVREGKSASDGTFELAAVTPGRLVVRAESEGFLDGEPKKLDVADGGTSAGVELELSKGNTVSGTVTWADGKPAADIAVEAQFDMSAMMGMGAFNAMRGADGKGKSNAQGAFAITGLGEGPFVLQAQAPAPGESSSELVPKSEDNAAEKSDSSPRWKARVEGVRPGATEVALVLRPPEGLAGRVVDQAGAPIAQFKVYGGREGKGGPLGNIGQETREESFEDAEGKFLLAGLTEGSWKLYAMAKGFARPEPTTVTIPRTADESEVVITLAPAASVAGVVKNQTGQVVSGATIGLDTGEANWAKRLQGGPDAPEAKSAADGTFLLEGLLPGKAQIVADTKDHARSLPVELVLVGGQRTEGVELVLRAGGTLTGQVFADDGRPAKGRMVQATELKVYDSQMQFTDAAGEFRLEHLEPGSWQVVAMPSEAAPEDDAGTGEDDQADMMKMVSKMKMAMVEIADGEETHIVLGAPPKDPVTVHGEVTHNGEPAAGSMVVFIAEGKKALAGMKTCQVEKDGRYSIQLDAPGAYDITIQKLSGGIGQQSSIEFARDIPETKDHRLDFLLPTARISGRIRGPDGEAGSGVRVTLQPESSVEAGSMWGGHYHEGVADGDGHFDIQMLRPGTYSVAAGGATMGGMFGGDEQAWGREVRTGLRLDEGEWMRDVDFRLKKPGSLDVTVVDAAGATVGEASVFVRDANGRLVDGFSFVSTDAAGKAKYGGLAPGTYTVSARKELLASLEGPRVKVEEGASAPVQVALQPGTMLIVSCVGAEDKPVRASVSVQDEQGREVSAMVSMADVMEMFSEGGFSSTERKIGPLPQGKYKVRATGPEGKTVTRPVDLRGQAERKLTVRFDS